MLLKQLGSSVRLMKGVLGQLLQLVSIVATGVALVGAWCYCRCCPACSEND
jgi:hypothetical protein